MIKFSEIIRHKSYYSEELSTRVIPIQDITNNDIIIFLEAIIKNLNEEKQ